MYCPSCRNKIQQNQKSCPSCGYDLSGINQGKVNSYASSNQPSQEKSIGERLRESWHKFVIWSEKQAKKIEQFLKNQEQKARNFYTRKQEAYRQSRQKKPPMAQMNMQANSSLSQQGPTQHTPTHQPLDVDLDEGDTLPTDTDKLDTPRETELFPLKFSKIPGIQIFVTLIFLASAVFGVIYFAEIVSLEDTIPIFTLILGGYVLSIILWRLTLRRVYPRFIHYLVEHRFVRKLVAGGSLSFYEYKNPQDERISTMIFEPIGMLISTLVTLLGIVTTVIGLIRRIDPEINVQDPLLWASLTFLAPILAVPLLPVVWGLDDAKVKSWNKKTNTNWLVSKPYRRRFNSVLSISAILANLTEGFQLDTIIEQLQVLIGILRIGAVIVLVSVSLLILSYYTGFRRYLRKMTLNSLNLDTYQISLEKLEVMQFQAHPEENNAEIIPPAEKEETKEPEESPLLSDTEVTEIDASAIDDQPISEE